MPYTVNNENIKILLVTHKPCKILDGKCFVPIHAGREIAKELNKDGMISSEDFIWLENNTIGDDSDDNISSKNRYYCECSALYWAWKNYDKLNSPDYIGLMHYRRHFVFNEQYFQEKTFNVKQKILSYIDENFIDATYQKNIGLTDENIKEICPQYDIVVTKDARFDLRKKPTNMREDFEKIIPDMKVKDFDLMMETIKTMYPDYVDTALSFAKGYNKSLYQMFIMKKELFFEYGEFLFGVLSSIEKQVDFSSYTVNGKRTLGYLAENLLSIFVMKKINDGKKVLKLGVTQVLYPYELDNLEEILKKGKPSYLSYIMYKLKYKFSKGKDKFFAKNKYKKIKYDRIVYGKILKYKKERLNK